jgi:AhpD family alkylhydroperoxidase
MIKIGPEPGILGLLTQYKDTAQALSLFAQAIMRDIPSNLSHKEREVVAAVASYYNKCKFCTNSHNAIADALDGDDGMGESLFPIVRAVVNKEKVEDALIEAAQNEGYTDKDINLVVVIATAFCMFNRYVEALNPREASADEYAAIGKQIAEHGYL